VRHVVAGSANTAKFEDLEGDYTRIAVGAPRAGWLDFATSNAAPSAFTPDGATRATDPLLLYFTSGTTSEPKLVVHTHQSYPVGHLSTMYWIGLRPGDIHLNISSPGWAKHAWSCFFAPWNAGACVFIYNYARFNGKAMLSVLERCRVTTLCAPPTVWRMLIQEDIAAFRGRLAIRELIGAGEPLNPEVIDRVQAALGITRHPLRKDKFGEIGPQRHMRIGTREAYGLDRLRGQQAAHNRYFPGRHHPCHVELTTQQRVGGGITRQVRQPHRAEIDSQGTEQIKGELVCATALRADGNALPLSPSPPSARFEAVTEHPNRFVTQGAEGYDAW